MHSLSPQRLYEEVTQLSISTSKVEKSKPINAFLTWQAAGLGDPSKYKHIQSWMEKCKKEMKGYEEINAEGAKQMTQFLRSKLGDDGTAKV